MVLLEISLLKKFDYKSMDKKLDILMFLGLVIGAIIGWGSFTLPGTKFLREAGVINTFIGLLIGGVFYHGDTEWLSYHVRES